MNIEIAPKETEIKANWDDAMMYCQFLNVNGKTGWRLPTLAELDYIYKSKKDYFSAFYWSSTEYNNNFSWNQNMASGFQYSYSRKDFTGKSNRLFVRAVRDIK